MENKDYKDQVLLVGSYTHTLDAKRRLIFPSAWRHLIQDHQALYAFAHQQQPCLYLYLKDEMMRRIAQLRSEQVVDAQEEQAIRAVTAGAELIQWDAQGRIRIGEHLLRHIEATDQVVWVGTLTRIEVWSVSHFDLALPQQDTRAESLFFTGY